MEFLKGYQFVSDGRIATNIEIPDPIIRMYMPEYIAFLRNFVEMGQKWATLVSKERQEQAMREASDLKRTSQPNPFYTNNNRQYTNTERDSFLVALGIPKLLYLDMQYWDFNAITNNLYDKLLIMQTEKAKGVRILENYFLAATLIPIWQKLAAQFQTTVTAARLSCSVGSTPKQHKKHHEKIMSLLFPQGISVRLPKRHGPR
jgi:hypothetical protein